MEGRIALDEHRRFIVGLGLAQIVSWGTPYYAFPLIAVAMEADLGLSKPALYGAATFGLSVGSLAAYPVGAAIDRGHGRTVLSLGSVLAALLLCAWSQVGKLPPFYAVFAGIGVAQAMTLYDPVFAVAARRATGEARAAITALTLWGGFASTVFVPVTQALLDRLGWRQALAVLGALNLMICVPLHLTVVETEPRERAAATSTVAGRAATPRDVVRAVTRQPAFVALAIAFTLYSGAFAALTYHLYPLLLERRLPEASVVAGIALIGPAQVAGRIVFWWLARNLPIQGIGMATVVALPLSLVMLIALPSSFAWLAGFAVIYGAANGVMTIVRGLAVPEMVTTAAYGELNGILAVPASMARSVAPVAAAVLWSAFGSYDLVLDAALAMAVASAASFWIVALHRGPLEYGRFEV